MKKYSAVKPPSMLDKPTNRICPSLIRSAFSKTARQCRGLTKGKNPSTISINANAPSNSSQPLGATATGYFLAAGAVDVPGPPLRIDWKNSLLGSTTIRSDLLRKLAR